MDKLCALFDEQFVRLHRQSLSLIQAVPADKLYWQPREPHAGFPVYSCCEYVVRSAGTIEQTFGGITTNLWDDPFEWTLPETLSTAELVVDYVNAVEATRQYGFDHFKSDGDLMKEIVLPSGDRQTILSLLLRTLVTATHHQGCAFATFRLFSEERIPWN